MAAAASAIPRALAGTSASLDASVDQFQAFADAAPSEIKDDLQTVADGYADFVKVLTDANYNPASGQAPSPEVMAKIQAGAEKLEKQRLPGSGGPGDRLVRGRLQELSRRRPYAVGRRRPAAAGDDDFSRRTRPG